MKPVDQATDACILLVEDDTAHVKIAQRAFESVEFPCNLVIAGDLADARAQLAARPVSLIIADLVLPDGSGTELIRPHDAADVCPLVVMTSQGDETAAVEALKAGAIDYVVKSAATLIELPHMARRALREWDLIQGRRRAEQRLQDEERRHRALLDSVPDLILVISQTGQVRDCRGGRKEFSIEDPTSVVDRNLYDLVRRQTYENLLQTFRDVPEKREARTIVFELTLGDRQRHVEARVAPYDQDSVVLILRDVTERELVAVKLESLTSRELEVLQLVVQGEANKGIARALDISIKTVEAHRARVMKKLDARNMADLMRLALSVEEPE